MCMPGDGGVVGGKRLREKRDGADTGAVVSFASGICGRRGKSGSMASGCWRWAEADLRRLRGAGIAYVLSGTRQFIESGFHDRGADSAEALRLHAGGGDAGEVDRCFGGWGCRTRIGWRDPIRMS